MRLELMTSPQVQDYLERCRGIVLPVGSTEQHGPMGLIGTDHLCPQAIARGFGRARGVIVAPTLAFGMSQFHLGFPGSLTLRPSTLSAVIGDIIASLDVTGFLRLYILNGHGGNLAPIRSAVQEFYAAKSLSGVGPSRMMVRVRSWWELPTVNTLRKSFYGAAEGFHATPSELSVTMASEPKNIAEFDLPLPPETHDSLDHAGDNYLDAIDYRARFPDGRVVSHSALARREHGERLIAAGIADLADDFSAFIAAV